MNKIIIEKYINKALKKIQRTKPTSIFLEGLVSVESSQIMNRGDYSSNIALLIAKTTGEDPMKIAKILTEELRKEIDSNQIAKVDVARPGFINFWISKEELLNSLKKVLKQKDSFGSDKQNKVMVIDYSAPNIAKAFGVGHLRSTVIGQAIYNIYKFLGWKCIGDNHLGDWGTQFGKLVVAIKKWGQKDLKKLDIEELEKLYIKFHKEAEKDGNLLVEARESFKKIEQGDKEIRKIWKKCVEVSLKEYDKIYKILGVRIDYALGESFYEDKTQEIIKEIKEKGLAEQSQGALVVSLPEFKIPLMLLKSDGATTYATRDLATIKYRINKWHPDLIIWEVGVDQKFYFEQIFKVAEMLGYGKKSQFVHIAHGLIRWPRGKFSTRKGNTIHLESILKEAVDRAKQLVEQSQSAKSLSQKEKEKIAQKIGVGAIKYNDLSRHHSKDIIFDWDKILSLEGNSGPYIQYVAVRCQSIIEKAKSVGIIKKEKLAKIILEKEEESLLRKLRRFPEIVEKSATSFSPNLISNFIFDLAQEYNTFYEKYPILKAKTEEKRSLRLQLTIATRQILKNGLDLLGVSIPQKM